MAQLHSKLERDKWVEKDKEKIEKEKDEKDKKDEVRLDEAIPPDKNVRDKDKNLPDYHDDETVKDNRVNDKVRLKEAKNDRSSWVTEKDIPDKTILDLPDEIMLKVMSYLRPKDLGNFQQVCRDWSVVAKDPSLWRELHPVKWAKGMELFM